MIKIQDLKIDPHSLGDKFIFTGEITPSYDYKDGQRTNNINGYKYSVVLPNLKFEKINIKIPIEKKPAPLFDILSDEPIPAGIELGFKGLNVGTYYSQGNINIQLVLMMSLLKTTRKDSHMNAKRIYIFCFLCIMSLFLALFIIMSKANYENTKEKIIMIPNKITVRAENNELIPAPNKNNISFEEEEAI